MLVKTMVDIHEPTRVNPDPTLIERREASEPYRRAQSDSALKATPHSPKVDVWYVPALEPTARSGAYGLRSRRPRSLLTVLDYGRIRVNRETSNDGRS
jgi:hypothetical protein